MPPDEPTPEPQPNGAPQRGPDGKFLPAAATEPEPAPEVVAEPPKPKARDHAEFARRRRALEDKAKAVAHRERQLQEQAARFETQNAERDRLLAEMSKKLEQWEKGNPLAVAQAAGRDIDGTIREYLQQGTPEALAKEARAELEALKRELRAKDEAQTARERERQERGEQAAREARKAGFVQSLTADAKKFPYLNHEFDEAQLLDITARFDEWAAREGKAYTYEQAASELERLAKLRYAEFEPRRAALFRDQSNPSAPAPVSAGSGNGHPVSRPETARRAAPAPAPKPKPKSRALTKAEEAEADLALLRAATQKDRSANGKAS